jgi:hypothetical protein
MAGDSIEYIKGHALCVLGDKGYRQILRTLHLLVFHSNNYYANALHSYVMRTYNAFLFTHYSATKLEKYGIWTMLKI